MIAEEYLDDTDFEVYQDNILLKLIHHTILHEQKSNYSLIQKNGYTFAIVYSSKCVTGFFESDVSMQVHMRLDK
jgi:hypothetical protein